MRFGQNLQFLRKMHNGMTQEELAGQIGVSRQTISKWELDSVYPEMDKAIELCRYFSCTLDELLREDMNLCSAAYSDVRMETVPAFQYIRYAVISSEPEADAIHHVRDWAAARNIASPVIIGWDFPFVSQEQINVYHMHGYTAALVLPAHTAGCGEMGEILSQESRKYAVITIKEPFQAPFQLIPNAYKTLLSYLQVNGLASQADGCLPCFEKQYSRDGVEYLDVYLAVAA